MQRSLCLVITPEGYLHSEKQLGLEKLSRFQTKDTREDQDSALKISALSLLCNELF